MSCFRSWLLACAFACLSALASLPAARAAAHGAAMGVRAAQDKEIRLGGPALGRLNAVRLGEIARAALARAERVLEIDLQNAVELFVVDHEDLLDPEVAPHFRDWTVALANTRTGRIDVLSPRVRLEPPGDLGTVLTHEFVHVLLGQLEVELSGGSKHLPLWLHEGLAQFVAGQGWFPRHEEALAFRALTNRLLPFAHLENRFPEDASEVSIAYAQSLSFLEFCSERIGLDAVMRACREWLGSDDYESVDHALAYRLGLSFGTLAAEWKEELAGGRNLLRQLSGNCFEILLWFCVPLLVLVVLRRLRRGRVLRARMDRLERQEDLTAERRASLAREGHEPPISRGQNRGALPWAGGALSDEWDPGGIPPWELDDEDDEDDFEDDEGSPDADDEDDAWTR